MFKVKDWEQHFENDRSRTRDMCRFACVPNKQHGMGFTRLMQEPDGMAIYGVWNCIIGACSQQKRPREGFLTDDGSAEGYAWNTQDLANRWRRSLSEIDRAISVLSSCKIRWLEEVTADSPPTHRPVTRNGREWKGREGNGADEPLPPSLEGNPPKAETRRTRKIPDSDHARLIEHFRMRWEKRCGLDFIFVGGKDGKHFQTILNHAKSLERAIEIVDVYLADESKFVAEKFYPVGLLVSQLSTYAAKSASRRCVVSAKPGEKTRMFK